MQLAPRVSLDVYVVPSMYPKGEISEVVCFRRILSDTHVQVRDTIPRRAWLRTRLLTIRTAAVHRNNNTQLLKCAHCDILFSRKLVIRFLVIQFHNSRFCFSGLISTLVVPKHPLAPQWRIFDAVYSPVGMLLLG